MNQKWERKLFSCVGVESGKHWKPLADPAFWARWPRNIEAPTKTPTIRSTTRSYADWRSRAQVAVLQ